MHALTDNKPFAQINIQLYVGLNHLNENRFSYTKMSYPCVISGLTFNMRGHKNQLLRRSHFKAQIAQQDTSYCYK